ncbi:MAG: TolC family protein, partial [Bacteroidales bacterium]|nr:TolC family protein [Bacteroidales bacterium]
DIYEAQVSVAEASLQKLQKQEEIGQKSHADVVQAEADLADRRYDAIEARNQYADQRTNLADLMFWPVDQELVIDTEIGTFTFALEDKESVIDYALSHDPGVKIAGWQVENARRELATARWQLLPSLSFNAGWSTSYFNYPGKDIQVDPYRDQLRNHQGEYLQLSMSIPIYNRLQGHDNIARKRNAVKKMTAQYDQKRREVASEVQRAVQDRDGAQAAYEQALRKASVQEEAYQLNAKKMEQGLISSIEYQTATNNYLRAQADEMNSLFKYLIKQAVVRYYNGVEYINQ